MKTSLAQIGAWVVMANAIFASASSWSQAYPVKPIRLVTSGPAGGGVDVIARPLARRLSEALGQQVLVDNRPGANGTVAGHLVATSPPDG